MTSLTGELFAAVEEGNEKRVRYWLDCGADIHSRDEEALHIACYKGYVGIVRLLVDRGACIHVYDDEALRRACAYGHVDCVIELCQRGAHAGNAMGLACEMKRWECVLILMQYGAILPRCYASGLRSFLREKLNDAALSGNIEKVAWCLDQGVGHETCNEAFHTAYQADHLACASFILTRGADIHDDYDRALNWACQMGKVELTLFLLNQGADLHAHYDRALRTACRKGHLECAAILVDRGADIHAMYDEALRVTCNMGHLECVSFLLDHGADIHVMADRPFEIAVEKSNHELLRLLASRFKPDLWRWGCIRRCVSHRIAGELVRWPIKLCAETVEFHQRFSLLVWASKVLRRSLVKRVGEYVYAPWGRDAVERLELIEVEEGVLEERRLALRSERNVLIDQVLQRGTWPVDWLIERYARSVEFEDRSGCYDLLGEGATRPSLRQFVHRLPTKVLRDLATRP